MLAVENPLEAAFASGGLNTRAGLPTEMNVAVGLSAILS